MEAIFELIGALLVGLVELALIPLRIGLSLLGMVVEFLFLMLFQGMEPAKEKFQQRQQHLQDRAAARNAAPSDPDAVDVKHQRDSAATRFRRAMIVAGLTLVGIAIASTIWVISERIRQRRIEATKIQLAQLADKFVRQVKDEQEADPEKSLLPDRDAWGQRIELFVDEALLGTLIVVRSAGPDRRTGSLDDLLNAQVAPASIKQVGGELTKRGLENLGERVKRLLPENLLPGKQDDEIPDGD